MRPDRTPVTKTTAASKATHPGRHVACTCLSPGAERGRGEMSAADLGELEELQSNKKLKIATYNAAVKSAVEEGFNDSKKLQDLVERMLSRDPQNLPNLEGQLQELRQPRKLDFKLQCRKIDTSMTN